MKPGTVYAVWSLVSTSSPVSAELLRQCLARLGCAPAEFAARHLFVSASVLNRLLNGQRPSPSLETTILDVARRLGLTQSATPST